MKILLITLSLLAAATQVVADGLPQLSTSKRTAVLLEYVEVEADAGEQAARLLITPQYLRLDNGNDIEGFVLLDRRQRVIYNVDPAEKSVMVIADQARDVAAPMELKVEIASEVLANAPKVAGSTLSLHRITVNGTLCDQVIAAPGVLADAAQAMRVYREVLAAEHKRILPFVPPETHEGCDLALNVFEPDLPTRFGLIVREWNAQGYQRILTNYVPDYRVDAGLFELPPDYRQYALE